MHIIGISHLPKKTKGITKADKEVHKSNDILKRDFVAGRPNKKAVTDITEFKLFSISELKNIKKMLKHSNI